MVNHSPKYMATWNTSANRLEADVCPERLCDVTKSLLSRWLAIMQDNGLSPASQRTYVAHVRAALSWACNEVDLLDSVPKVKLPRGSSRKMRSRPVTPAEFPTFLAAIPQAFPDDVPRLTKICLGLWHGGLRIDEVRRLSWDQDSPFCITQAFEFPLIRILAGGQKAKREEYQPVTREFWDLIKDDPRDGQVFPIHEHLTDIVKKISAIGRLSGIVTDSTTSKCATSHDIGKRAFLSRMDGKLSMAELQKWARHASPETTMQFYHHKSAIELARKVGF